MAKFNAATIVRWNALADKFLSVHKMSRDDIKTGRDAWTVSARCGINDEAYKDRDVTDGHIQTALEKVFPFAVFKDKKVY